MSLLCWVFYIIMGIILYFGLEYVSSKYKINKTDKIVFSTIFVMITSGICFKYSIRYTENIFLVFVFCMITDMIYNTYFIDRDFFDKSEKNVLYYIVLIIIGFFINQSFINDVSHVFLTGDDLRIVLWLLVILYLYSFFKGKGVFNSEVKKNRYMSVNSVLSYYAKFKYTYYDDCKRDEEDLTNVLYAIMIYENSRRNKILRSFDNFKFRINGTKAKLGIMQIDSKKFISDTESIDLSYNKLKKIYKKRKTVNYDKIFDDYYGYDNSYVKYIFNIIKKM